MLKKLLFFSLLTVSCAYAMEPVPGKRQKRYDNPLEDGSSEVDALPRYLSIEQPAFVKSDEDVAIQTEDDQHFIVPIQLIKLSETLKNLIEDAGIDHPIPLPNITAYTWQLTQSLLERVSVLSGNDAALAPHAKNSIIATLQDLRCQDLVDFITAVNYLDIPILLNIVLDVVKQADVSVMTPEQLIQLPKEIANPIVLAHILRALAPLQGQQQQVIKGFKRAIAGLCVSPNGNKIYTTHINGIARIWDMATGQQLSQFGHASWGRPGLGLLPDESAALLGFHAKPIIMWDLAANKVCENVTFERPDNAFLGVHTFQVTPDGTKIVCKVHTGFIIVWDRITGKIIHRILSDARLVCVSSDSKYLVLCALNGAITLHDMESGVRVESFPKIGDGSCVDGVLITPDQSKIILNYAGRVLFIKDFKTGADLNRIGYDEQISAICVTPDSSYILIGLVNGNIHMHELATGTLVACFKGHTKAVCNLKVVSQGSRFVSASMLDKTMRIWNLDIFARLRALSKEQAKYIWTCLYKKEIDKCRVYVQNIIVPQD
ncbi:MAG: hypothetical protein AB7F19_04610 [Candidatus Babeliales bacterium]